METPTPPLEPTRHSATEVVFASARSGNTVRIQVALTAPNGQNRAIMRILHDDCLCKKRHIVAVVGDEELEVEPAPYGTGTDHRGTKTVSIAPTSEILVHDERLDASLLFRALALDETLTLNSQQGRRPTRDHFWAG